MYVRSCYANRSLLPSDHIASKIYHPYLDRKENPPVKGTLSLRDKYIHMI